MLRRPAVHPFLAAAYPTLALLAANLGQVRPTVAYRPLILSLSAAALLLGILRLPLKDWGRAGLLTTWFIVLFFAYGHVYNALREVQIAGTTLGRHRFLVPAWASLAVSGAWWLLRRKGALSGLSRGVNVVLGLAVAFPLVQIVANEVGTGGILRHDDLGGNQGLSLEGVDAEPGQLPDIYYIILDAYARADTLAATFDYDNLAFLQQLQALGFYVAECSQANYGQTELSLASSLNGAYLDNLAEGPLEGHVGREWLWPLIRNSAVRQALEGMGYKVVAFETGYYWTELEDADVYLAPEHGLFAGMTAFEATLLRSTGAWALIDVSPVLPPGLLRDLDRSADAHRERLQFVFDQLAKVPSIAGPKFVFAHIVSPHRPFVFDAEGNSVDDDYQWTQSPIGIGSYAEGYRQQLTYLNRRLIPILVRIIAESDPPPVILLQGDHGPEEGSSQDRMKMLSAYLLSNAPSDLLYSRISPVNSFGIVFGVVFGAKVPTLEDRSLFSSYEAPFDFQLIAADCPP